MALVGVEQEAERVDDHAVGPADARRDVAGRVAAARAALGLQLERDALQRVGADRLRAREGHAVNLHRVPDCQSRGFELVLEVQDLERSEAFYAGLLGLPVVERWPQRERSG